jgi:hypothetical protein
LPLHAQPRDEFTATSLEGGRLLYIRSTSLSPYEGEIAVQLKAYLIVDGVVKSGQLPSDAVVYVITGRATNSAAIAFPALLKAGTHGRTKIVGEEPSDNPWFWSEGDRLIAPVSKLPLVFRDGRHDWSHGCNDVKTCYWPVVFHGVAAGSLMPDIPVEMTCADYVAGKDPALAAVLADIQGRRAAGAELGSLPGSHRVSPKKSS